MSVARSLVAAAAACLGWTNDDGVLIRQLLHAVDGPAAALRQPLRTSTQGLIKDHGKRSALVARTLDTLQAKLDLLRCHTVTVRLGCKTSGISVRGMSGMRCMDAQLQVVIRRQWAVLSTTSSWQDVRLAGKLLAYHVHSIVSTGASFSRNIQGGYAALVWQSTNKLGNRQPHHACQPCLPLTHWT